jgi:hypothetical protein
MKKTEPLLFSTFGYISHGSTQVMRLVVLVALVCSTTLSFGRNAQQDVMSRPVTLKFQNQRFETVLSSIEKQTKARIVYSSERIDVTRTVSLEVTKKRLDHVLEDLLSPLNLTYRLIGGQIVLEKLEKQDSGMVNPTKTAVDRTITGVLTDEKNAILPGVSVILKGTNRGTSTDGQGKFSLSIPDGNDHTLTFSFVGYQSQDIVVGAQSTINVSLKPDVGAH